MKPAYCMKIEWKQNWPSSPYNSWEVPLRENTTQHFILCLISSAMISTLWIFIIAIDTVVFPLLARTLSIIALALGYELMLGWEMQSSLRGKKNSHKTSGCLVWCASEFSPTAHSLLCMSMRGDVMNVFVFLSRVRQDRKGRSDRITDCQNWQDINSENAVNEIVAIKTSVEVVDQQQKVRHSYLIATGGGALWWGEAYLFVFETLYQYYCNMILSSNRISVK